MKFDKLIINNFMRFKGKNTVEFSKDPERNVTVVLGDNTVGKTTLAQAIRWCLYEEVIPTHYGNASEICLLNNDVLSNMTANDYASISVELDIVGDEESPDYRIIREATFVRKFPQMVAVQRSQKLKMYVKDPHSGSELPYDNTDGKVTELISEILPQDLSSYFLFDGERWNDSKNTRNDIKDSIYNLVGISPIREMKKHLGELGAYGRNGVIKTLESKKVGTGTDYVQLQKSIDDLSNRIDIQNKNIEDAKNNAEHYQNKADEIKRNLDSNKTVEEDQKECDRLSREIELQAKHIEGYKRDIISSFSNTHTYFAAPLLQDVIEMLDGIEVKGIDIPGITDKTIDAIIEKHKCICGHEIVADSFEEKELLKLKRLVPPATIGTIVGSFKDKLANWSAQSAELYQSIEDKADLFQQEYDDQQDTEEELQRKEQKIDRKINFADERAKMKSYQNQANAEQQKVASCAATIESLKHSIAMDEEKKKGLESKNKENAELDRYIAYASAIYESAKKYFESKEKNLLGELNEIIEKNFREMFNEQEKYAKLGANYDLHLYYRNIQDSNGYAGSEATGLSEGEKIARNFAFIVSILELANKMKAEGTDDAQSMPLVLDGPFSKLSDVNTAKVAGVLPEVADQVIIFMLDKDWEPSGLAAYTDPRYMYRVEKEVDENSSVVKRQSEV